MYKQKQLKFLVNLLSLFNSNLSHIMCGTKKLYLQKLFTINI